MKQADAGNSYHRLLASLCSCQFSSQLHHPSLHLLRACLILNDHHPATAHHDKADCEREPTVKSLYWENTQICNTHQKGRNFYKPSYNTHICNKDSIELTNFRQQSPSWDRNNNHSIGQEIPHLLWNLKVYYRGDHNMARKPHVAHTRHWCSSCKILLTMFRCWE
jgi:hypothetical protein